MAKARIPRSVIKIGDEEVQCLESYETVRKRLYDVHDYVSLSFKNGKETINKLVIELVKPL